MPRTREQFSEMKDERLNSILGAALPLFSMYGKKVSIDAISAKAKCSHGIVYHYFKNSEEIYEKLLNSSTFVELNNRFANITEGSSYEKIEEIMSVLLDVSEAKFENVCYLNIIIKNEDKNSLFATLVKLVKEGQNSGKIIAGEPAEVVNTVFFVFKGIYLSFLQEKHPNIKVPSLENVMQLIRKPVLF
mgnify:CR=1 FL=1